VIILRDVQVRSKEVFVFNFLYKFTDFTSTIKLPKVHLSSSLVLFEFPSRKSSSRSKYHQPTLRIPVE